MAAASPRRVMGAEGTGDWRPAPASAPHFHFALGPASHATGLASRDGLGKGPPTPGDGGHPVGHPLGRLPQWLSIRTAPLHIREFV